MAKIKAFVLKSLVAFSAVLTAWQVKMVNAQIVYMGPPNPHITPPVTPTTPSGSGDSLTTWIVGVVIFLLVLTGLVVVIKYLVGLLIRLFRKK